MAELIDTRFRSALRRMIAAQRIRCCTREADPHLEIAALMKRADGEKALLFPRVKGFETPVIGNFLASKENCEAAFGVDFNGIRSFVDRALGNPVKPVAVKNAPVQDVVRPQFDVREIFPALFHAPSDSGRYITAGIVIVQDPETGIYNASYHRLQLQSANEFGIKLDLGRHLRLAFERALARKQDLPIAVVLGSDIALQFTAATMGSQMPETADELAVAGGLSGSPLPVVKAVSQDLFIPAECEFAIEGVISATASRVEGPFGEFVGFMAPAADAPIFKVTAVTHRRNPIYHAINGYGRETIVLRKYVLEASLLKVLRAAIPIVTDAEMTAGGLHRFHAVVQLAKKIPAHDGLQRNAIMASFGALKDLDMVIVVDDDIDIRDPADVEYALATRMEASRDIIVIPEARGHEYVRVSNNGIRAKLGIDATVPVEDRERFRRVEFAPINSHPATFNDDNSSLAAILGVEG